MIFQLVQLIILILWENITVINITSLKNSYSWTQAKQNALDLGGQMLVIEDADENEFVSSIMIRPGTWVGYSRATEADSWG